LTSFDLTILEINSRNSAHNGSAYKKNPGLVRKRVGKVTKLLGWFFVVAKKLDY